MIRLLLLAGILVAVLMWMNGRGTLGGAGHAAPMTWDKAHLETLAADLSTADGKPAPPGALGGAKRTLVYFSASWCPPCRAFTPELVAWYKAHGDPAKMPLLFVSFDRDAADMRAYMSDDHMPWWGVAFGSASAQALTRSYAGTGIPDLVLLDEHGQVLVDSYADGRYLGPHQVLAAVAAGK